MFGVHLRSGALACYRKTIQEDSQRVLLSYPSTQCRPSPTLHLHRIFLSKRFFLFLSLSTAPESYHDPMGTGRVGILSLSPTKKVGSG